MGDAGNGVFQVFFCFPGMKDRLLLDVNTLIDLPAQRSHSPILQKAGQSLIAVIVQLFQLPGQRPQLLLIQKKPDAQIQHSGCQHQKKKNPNHKYLPKIRKSINRYLFYLTLWTPAADRSGSRQKKQIQKTVGSVQDFRFPEEKAAGWKKEKSFLNRSHRGLS